MVVPIGADQEIEAGLGAVHRADLGEAVGPEVGRLIDPVALAEIRNLNDHRLAAEIENAEAVDEILAGAGDVALLRADIVVQHGKMVDRRDRRNAADEQRTPEPLERGVAVEHIHQRPAPEISEAADLAHELGRKP